MRRVPKIIVALFGICLLTMQMSGSHLHVDAFGQNAGLHGTHLHHSDPEGHDHSAATDVSLFERGIAWSKLITLLISCVIVLLAASWILRPLWLPPIRSSKTRHRVHWRPLLRAPPVSL